MSMDIFRSKYLKVYLGRGCEEVALRIMPLLPLSTVAVKVLFTETESTT